ncbi:PhzF family phenazine biosynthesis protein [Rhodocytophaga rosea]|uniref:PhzF family phenazine biosynthesis protein n=1 Tax=Rhodocytophaga rosea TaxID=2704465 RepID=A0A6C0GLT5_9BACT|nr:PhzF family phenazine biosynthesis protein [Rhodocytophaga rosea]QHT68603.1 PhzF family phenazine biosynthesis protein [Rhodocytophaga rosea]
MEVKVQIVNAFVDGDHGGNPAGVVLDADSLTSEQKLQIAAQVGLSETAFVSRSALADFKLDFFTPAKQIPHCGHATIATFSYLQSLGRIPSAHTSKETIDGSRQIWMRGEQAFMEQKPPQYQSVPELEERIFQSLGISKDDLIEGKSPIVVNTGNSFLIIPLQNQHILRELKPQLAEIESISQQLHLIGFYPFSLQTQRAQRDATTRMFGPLYGIPEESATGMAAGPLACYMHDIMSIKKDSYLIEQGYLMNPPSPSLITVELEKNEGAIQKLMAGGKGIVMQQKTVVL